MILKSFYFTGGRLKKKENLYPMAPLLLLSGMLSRNVLVKNKCYLQLEPAIEIAFSKKALNGPLFFIANK